MSTYLLDGEELVAAQNQHWASLIAPVGMCVGGFVLAVIAGLSAPASMGTLTDLAWRLWFVLLAYAAIRAIMWRHDWFVATDKRLMLRYGVLKRRVAMMPLAKVTDMSFNRSALGRWFGYGQFVLESAGQEQALRQIDFVRSPDDTYRRICAEIFGEVSATDTASDEDDPTAGGPYDQDRDPTDPYLHLQLVGAQQRAVDPTDIPVRPVGNFARRPETHERAERPRSSRLRHRVLRGSRQEPEPEVPFGHEGDTGWTMEDRNKSFRPRDDASDD